MQVESFTDRDYDVIVVGGGPAGASAAIHLSRGGARVVVVEQKKFPREKLCGEFISPECLEQFARLGVLEAMSGAGGADLRETVFYAASGRAVAVPSEWFGVAASRGAGVALGLSRAEMDARLLARAREVGACVLEETHAAGVLIEGGRVSGVRVQTRGAERVLRASVTVDATGRTRALARKIGRMSGAAKDDERVADGNGSGRRGLVAFKAHLEGARVAEGACEIYFYRGGYGGLSSVERGRSNLCFIVAAVDVRARGSDAERVMREVVMSNRRAAESLKDARVASQWLAVALEGFGKFAVAPTPGLLTVGDAASFIDPFTGSGMLMALEGGELAADVIARALPRLRAGVARDGASFESVDATDETDDATDARNALDAHSALDALAAEYRTLYRERFGARLRVCSHLRRAAFAPGVLVELGVAALGASARLRRRLARATRGGEPFVRRAG
jgi:flavin-dependent dehydrogenase